MACPTLTPDGPFVTALLGYIDCQAQTIGASGYQMLASPGSSASIALTAALTLFVALFGYRLLFGQAPGTRGTVLAIVKVGIVLALATSWSAYRTVLYDVTLHTPAELAADIGGSSSLPGAGGGLEAHLQAVDTGLTELVRLGTGRPPDVDGDFNTDTQAPPPEQPQQLQQRFQQIGQRPRWDPQRDQELLGSARTLYLAGTIGSLAAVRLIAGVLLALGPLFALFLLFDATRGVFDGWLRALAGAAIGGVTTAILLGVELAVLEPWLAAILADRQANIATPAVPIELLALAMIFALTLLAGLIAAGRIAYSLHVPAFVRAASTRALGTVQAAVAGEHAVHRAGASTVNVPERSRARVIADAATATQRREAQAVMAAPFIGSRMIERGGNPQTPARGADLQATMPIGQSTRRRTAHRVSAGTNRREAL